MILDSSKTILRFATAFGLSKRMRFDLTVNEFVKTAFLKENLEIYHGQTYRPYCHVNDFAKIIHFIIKSPTKKPMVKSLIVVQIIIILTKFKLEIW